MNNQSRSRCHFRSRRSTSSSRWTASAALLLAALPARAARQEQTAEHSGQAGAGAVRATRISPDGAWVVFSADQEASGAVELHRVPVDGGSNPVRIGGPLLVSSGERWSISPDGRRVVYVGQDLVSVALDGSSAPVRLSDPGAPPVDFVSSPDGSRVVYRGAPVGEYAGLFSVATDGSSQPIVLVPPGGAGEVGRFQVEPRGRAVVFTSRHENGAFPKLYRAPIDGGSVVVLDSPRFGIRDYRISLDGGRIVYRCFREASEACELDVVPVDGSLPPTRLALAREGGDIQDFEIGFDGGWVVYLADQGNGRSELFSVPADGSAAPIVLGRDLASSFEIHPGGDRVLYRADHEHDDRFALFLAPIDGRSAPLELNAPLGPVEHVGWFGATPDGARIVYQVRHGGNPTDTTTNLWQVSLAEGLARTRLAETGVADGFQISPDGSCLLYRDQSSLRSVALDGSAAPLVLEAGLVTEEFRISPDGGRIIYRSQRENARVLASVRADGARPPVRLHATPGLRPQPGGSSGGQVNSTASGTGFRDFSFGTTGSPTPTSEKPECKLWWNDGFWWGSLYNDAAQDYHIYGLNPATQNWVDTGTVLDDRTSSKADVLWVQENQKLYVASHIFTTSAQATASDWGRLLRYSYSSASKVYTLDAGFPVDITRGNAEALTIARDTRGRLWATWVEAARVMVNRSLASDAQWGTPFVLPVSPASVAVTSDDLSAIIAFDGRVGVMWSNQLTSATYFAVHQDEDADTQWHPEELVVPGASCSGACADDHINLKADSAGRVFAALKTSLTEPDQPLNLVVVRGPNGGWFGTEFGLVRDDHTRPILLLDEQNDRVHAFATSHLGGGAIYYKSAPLSNLRFEPGLGTPFIQNAADIEINNATSTRQNLDNQTDLVVLASDEVTRFYLHNYLDLGAGGGAPPTIGSFSPTSGPVGTNVTVSGTNFNGTTGVRFNGTAADFSVSSSTQLRATVPAGATTGQISVTTPGGTATTSGAFTVTRPPSIGSFSPTSGPVGTSVTVTGASLGGTNSVKFNGAPATFNVVSSTEIRTSVPAGATTGRISVTTPNGTATSAVDFRVTRPPPDIDSFLPQVGFVLAPVTIIGSSFSGATSVTFNGRSAAFTVVSDGVIVTSVPLGASTGKVTVTTSAGTGVSATDFVVIGL